MRKLLILLQERNRKKWMQRIWRSPRHKVIETESALYIDSKCIDNILADSVKVESFGEYSKIITFSFVAKSYQKIN